MRFCPRCSTAYEGNERFCTKDAVVLVEQSDFARLGSTIGNYKLLDILGRGGMGTVYRGEHVYIGKPVAVKILHERFARYDEAVKRFLREARAASAINHPNIVDVTDFGPMPDGGVYFVMEYLEGESLETLVEREAPIELHRTINVIYQIASALSAAHEKGIVHRDLKPENIVLTRRPGRREIIRAERDATGTQRFVIEREEAFDFVKVLDFGIAKVLEPEAAHSEGPGSTMAGTIIGTPEYMSPEAAKGLPVDHRADIYSLGVMFFDMLTGSVPFTGNTPIEILAKHIAQPPPLPRIANPKAEITETAEKLILKSLSKDPEDRQRSMDEFLEELQHCYGSVAYRRDASNSVETKLPPRPKRLTEELDDWLKAHQAQLQSTQRLLEQVAAAPEAMGIPLSHESAWNDVAKAVLQPRPPLPRAPTVPPPLPVEVTGKK